MLMVAGILIVAIGMYFLGGWPAVVAFVGGLIMTAGAIIAYQKSGNKGKG